MAFWKANKSKNMFDNLKRIFQNDFSISFKKPSKMIFEKYVKLDFLKLFLIF